MDEGVYELHWQRREFGLVTLQLFQRHENGQLALVDSTELGPFDGAGEVGRWLARSLHRVGTLPVR
jgi:hypothetical protein